MQSQIIKYEDTNYTNLLLAKVNSSSSSRIIIEIKEHAAGKLSIFDLFLLQRSARKRNARLALVTTVPFYKSQAALLGIPVFSTVTQANRSIWRRKSKHDQNLPITGSDMPLSRSDMEKVKAKTVLHRKEAVDQGRNPQFAKTMLRRRSKPGIDDGESKRILRFSLVILVCFVFVLFLLLILPSASVAIHLPEKTQSTVMEIHAAQDIEATTLTGGIPLMQQNVIIQKEGQMPGTGSLLIEDKKAQGIIEMTNLTDEEVHIPAGTIVIAIKEPVVRFKTIEQGVVPAGTGEKLELHIEALQAGTAGNVDAGDITAFAGTTGLYVSVTNPEALSGGSDKISIYPSEEDYRELKKQILQQLTEEAKIQMAAGIEENEQLVPESVVFHSIVDERRYPEAGEPADFLILTIEAEFVGWSFNTVDVQRIATSILDANLEAGYTGVDDSMRIENIEDVEVEHDNITWSIQASRIARPSLPDNLVYSFVGQPVGAMIDETIEQYHLTEEPEVALFPFWSKRFPYLSSRITVRVE